MDARETVAEAIRDHGPVTFDEFMELALYGVGGYYERPPVGPDGDFVTSPHVHPVFAELLARGIGQLYDRLGRPRPFLVTEVGAGDGTLARNLLPHLAPLDVAYTAVERSAGAREALASLPGIEVSDRIDGQPHLVLANELLDNLPVRRFRGTPSGTKEVRIGLEGDRFVERLVDPGGDEGPLEAGTERVIPIGATSFVETVAARLARPGFVLVIDYGAAGEPGGPVHGYRAHRPVEDLLDRPGSSDITVGVDFDLVAEHAERHGLIPFPSVTQRHALSALGFDRWIHDELGRQAALLDAREGVAAVRAWSGRSRATLLVDPSALGRLRWLLLATPGLAAPAWI